MDVLAVIKQWADGRYEVIGVTVEGQYYTLRRGTKVMSIYLPQDVELSNLSGFLDRVMDNVRAAGI